MLLSRPAGATTRRELLRAAAGFALAGAAPAGAAWAATAAAAAALASAGPRAALATVEVAPGIHMRRGVDEDASAANLNAIATAGFIVGSRCVAVIDPGGSLADGRRLRTRLREVTALPIRYVVMSHDHPDHVFGASAFCPDGPEFVGHARLPNALVQRGEYYRLRLERLLGREAAGSVIVPTRLVVDRDELDLGGRMLSLTAHGVAHSDCDLSAFDRASATLLPADLLFVGRIPALDGSIKGWQRELAVLKALPAVRAVPGHGPLSVDWPAAVEPLERYLGVLQTETREAFARGLDLSAAVATVGASERGRWTLFEDYHGHNVTQAFKEIEWE